MGSSDNGLGNFSKDEEEAYDSSDSEEDVSIPAEPGSWFANF